MPQLFEADTTLHGAGCLPSCAKRKLPKTQWPSAALCCIKTVLELVTCKDTRNDVDDNYAKTQQINVPAVLDGPAITVLTVHKLINPSACSCSSGSWRPTRYGCLLWTEWQDCQQELFRLDDQHRQSWTSCLSRTRPYRSAQIPTSAADRPRRCMEFVAESAPAFHKSLKLSSGSRIVLGTVVIRRKQQAFAAHQEQHRWSCDHRPAVAEFVSGTIPAAG